VNIDKAGRGDLICGIDRFAAICNNDSANARDASVLDANVSAVPWISTTVHYPGILDYKIICGGLRLRLTPDRVQTTSERNRAYRND